jgi:hypothetical protein
MDECALVGGTCYDWAIVGWLLQVGMGSCIAAYF